MADPSEVEAARRELARRELERRKTEGHLEVMDDKPEGPGFMAGFREATEERDQRVNAAPDTGPLDEFLGLMRHTPIGQTYNYAVGLAEDPSGIGRDLKTIGGMLAPNMQAAYGLATKGEAAGPLADIGRAVKGDKLGEMWDYLKHDAGRTVASGGLDPKRPILSPADTVSAGSMLTKVPAVAAKAGRGVSRAASATGRGFKAKSLSNELGELSRDVKNTRSLERAVNMPAKHAEELRRLHTKLLRSEKDIRRLKPHIQQKYRAAWDAKRAGDPRAAEMYDDAFRTLMGDERTPAIETQRAAMKIKEGDAARALLDDADAVEAAMKNRQLAQKQHGAAVQMLDDIGQNRVADALDEAQKWAGRTGSFGSVATGAATGSLPAAAGTAALGYGTKALLQSARATGGAANLFYKIAGHSNRAAQKLARMGITAESPAEKVLRVHALLSTVDEDYAREVEGL